LRRPNNAIFYVSILYLTAIPDFEFYY